MNYSPLKKVRLTCCLKTKTCLSIKFSPDNIVAGFVFNSQKQRKKSHKKFPLKKNVNFFSLSGSHPQVVKFLKSQTSLSQLQDYSLFSL